MWVSKIFKSQVLVCDMKRGGPDAKTQKPESMLELIQSGTTSTLFDSSTRILSEPGTYYGFAAGACTGFAMKKVAKAAAFTFGAVFVGFQLAAQTGYVKVDWGKVEHDLRKYLPDKPTGESELVKQSVDWLTTNTGIAASVFTVGFVTGLKMG